MNQKVYSVVLCTILASTFLHEFRVKAQAHPSFLNHVVKKRAIIDPTICPECTTSNTSLNIQVNVAANLLSLGNLTANACIVIDAGAGLLALLNGKSGVGVILNTTSNTGVLIPSAWNATNSTLGDFLDSLVGGLTPLLNAVGGTVIQVLKPTTSILQIVNEILTNLIPNLASELRMDLGIGLRLVLDLVGGILGLLRGVLSGLLGLIGSVVIAIPRDLMGIFYILEGLGMILGNVVGGVTSLVDAGLTNIINALTAGNGLEVLGNLIFDIGLKLDLGPILNPLVNDVESLLNLLNDLGGNVNTLASGLIKVLSNLVSYLLGRCGLAELIYVIIQYLTSNTPAQREASPELLNELLVDLRLNITLAGLNETLSGLIDTVDTLLNNNLTVAGVNISGVINTLSQDDPSLLNIVVRVLLQLSPSVSPATTIPSLLFVLISLVDNIVGVGLLRGLGIVLDIVLSSVTGLLAVILKSVLNLVSGLVRNLLNILYSLPVIGPLVRALVGALYQVAGGLVNLQDLLDPHTLVGSLLIGLLSGLSGTNRILGIPSNTTSQAMMCMKVINNGSLYLNDDLECSACLL